MNPTVSIIIVHYKARKELIECINSIKKAKPRLKYEIIIVDNDSENIQSKLISHFGKIKYIKSKKNIGYAKANNLGAKVAKGKYLFFLNPDTLLFKNSIENLVSYLNKNPKTYISAPLIYNKDNKISNLQGSMKLTPFVGIVVLSFLNKIFPNNPISMRYFLKDRIFENAENVDVVSGSAFLIRKEIFNKVKGFDKEFFLYFEESDLCKRVKKMGGDIVIIPNSKIIHYWGVSTKDRKKALCDFKTSRYYYFRKHFGIFPALLVEVFARFSGVLALLLAIFLIGTFLRFYRLPENLVFNGEIGQNYLAIKDYIIEKHIPLIGPPTSHPWLYFGPFFYWIFAPVLILSKFNPLGGAHIFAITGSVVIILNYWVVNKFFEKKIAILSSYIIAISPLWIAFTKDARFYSLTTLLFYPFFIFLIQEKLFWAGIFYGLMLNFHLSPLIFVIPIIIFLYIRRKNLSTRNITNGFIGLTITFLPIIIFSVNTKFEMLKNFLVWIPYRVLGFLGIYPKNNLNKDILLSNFKSFYLFVGNNVSYKHNLLVFIFVMLFIAYILWQITNLKKNKTAISSKLLLMFLVFGYIGIFIHGNPPAHYYLPLYPVIVILISEFITKIYKYNLITRFLVIFILIFFTLNNFLFYFSHNWFYISEDKINNNLVPYKMQIDIVETIIKNANGNKFELERRGIDDQFEGNYAQNYKYLLWWLGNEPTENSRIKYLICENKPGCNKDTIYNLDGVSVTKIKL